MNTLDQFPFSLFQEENLGGFYRYFDFLGEAINGTLKIADKALTGAMDRAEKNLDYLDDGVGRMLDKIGKDDD